MKISRLPKLVRFIIKNSLIGLVIGWVVATGLLASNINGFGGLVLHSDHMLVAMFIVYFSFGLTFAFAYLTTAVLLMPTKREDFDRI